MVQKRELRLPFFAPGVFALRARHAIKKAASGRVSQAKASFLWSTCRTLDPSILQIMNTQIAEQTVSILDLDAQMQAREGAAYQREVDASISRGLEQARDVHSSKVSLDEMHARLSANIVRVAKPRVAAERA